MSYNNLCGEHCSKLLKFNATLSSGLELPLGDTAVVTEEGAGTVEEAAVGTVEEAVVTLREVFTPQEGAVSLRSDQEIGSVTPAVGTTSLGG